MNKIGNRRKPGFTDDVIIKMHKKGMRNAEIAEKAGVSAQAIRNVLKKHGIVYKRPRKYKVNEDFFKTWSNEMAYVLGMVLTDGCVTKRPDICQTKFSISQKEKYILERIRDVMGSDHKILEPTKSSSSHNLNIYSKEMVEDLIRLGITPNKAHTVEMPNVPVEYMSHFVRGVIDGDGHVHKKGYDIRITSASKVFSDELILIFKKFGVNVKLYTQKQGRNEVYRIIIFGKNEVKKTAEWIYRNSGDLCLERKKARMLINKQFTSECLTTCDKKIKIDLKTLNNNKDENWLIKNGKLILCEEINRQEIQFRLEKEEIEELKENSKKSGLYINQMIVKGVNTLKENENLKIPKKIYKNRRVVKTTLSKNEVVKMKKIAEFNKISLSKLIENVLRTSKFI